MSFAVIRPVLLVLTLLLTSGFEAAAQGRHLRKHTVTEATSLTLVPATKMLAKGRAVMLAPEREGGTPTSTTTRMYHQANRSNSMTLEINVDVPHTQSW